MKRGSLLWGILALLAVMAAAVAAGSPYVHAAEEAPEDIERIWAIEDARRESETPLVTALEMNGVPLAYCEQENTFYCTLGLEDGENWPQMRLTAPQNRDVRLMLVDDCTYDWRSDAVAKGNAYQVLAYTDTAFWYFDLVFTGLPIVQLEAGTPITEEDTPVEFTFSVFGEAAQQTPARAHLHGDRSLSWKPKHGYKVEFTRGGTSSKVPQHVAGIGLTDEILLLPLAIDNTMMRDRLSWDIVGMAFDPDESFCGLPCRYVELFAHGQYEGVYLMITPYDIGDEMRKSGQETIFRDSLYRVTSLEMEKDRPVLANPTMPETGFELFYAPNMEHGFDGLDAYMALLTEPDDEEFTQMALACLDLDSLLRYTLIMQLGCMVDNANNNLYIWAHSEGGQMRYRFAFWDMDLTWGMYAGDEGDRWVELAVAERVIALDVGGARRRIGELWEALKQRGITAETIEALVTQYVHELGDSGAYARDARRWEKGGFSPDGYEIVSFASARFEMMEAWVNALGE